jgi:hypothetical protein
VPEIVERAERLLDPRPLQRRLQVALGELARLERRPLGRMAEDEVVVAAIGGALPLLLEDGERA